MFGIYRQNRCAVLLCQLIYQFTGHDQRLFVCQRDGLPGTDGIDGRFQSGIAYHGR